MKRREQVSLVNAIRAFIKHIIRSRLFAFSVVLVVMMGVLTNRLFVLQIIRGEDYLNNYTLLVEKERDIAATRGNIYDCNGEVLAYNELAYSVVIEDNGTYESSKQRSKELNEIIKKTILIIEEHGDSVENNFDIVYEDGKFAFKNSGTTRLRFLADVFGRKTVDELKFNSKLGIDEANATAKQVVKYLVNDTYEIEDVDDERLAFEIAVVRYGLSANFYRRFISTSIATGVSIETVAAINENLAELQGVSIVESTLRRYVDSEYFCHIIGYTGKISQNEFNDLGGEEAGYSLNDYVGKAGIEQVMESTLKGKKGNETFHVDNLGKIVNILERTDSVPGNDIYLSIDKELQETVYNLLEQEIAGIVYSSIYNIRSIKGSQNSTRSDVVIPIYDVYYALIDNNIIDIDNFAGEDAEDVEKQVYGSFKNRYDYTLEIIRDVLTDNPVAFKNMSLRMREYINYIVSMLKDNDILVTSAIDKKDEVYKNWYDGTISAKEYIQYCIFANWIDVSKLTDVSDEAYSDSEEIYDALLKKIEGMLVGERDFHKLIYKYMIDDDALTGTDICLLLFEQDVLAENEADVQRLQSHAITPFAFLKEKIKNLEITPAQLALDPCTGSCVITDPQTGELKACVTYPGYDNNRLANFVDSDYYNSLLNDKATPLYDFATQQETAPGSTFKPFIATIALTEGIISPYDQILDEGVFKKVDNEPKCWLYRSSHGSHGNINVSEALRDSCNYFFYELGYDLSLINGVYSDKRGINIINNYADLFGISEKTGVEIPESEPLVATEYPVMASIGQSNNSYTTIGLARYVTAVANKGTVYKFTLLKKVTKSDGTVVKEFAPSVRNTLDIVSPETWTAVHLGMKMVAENTSVLKNLPLEMAGKTGTAQQITTRPAHALFIGFAPFDRPTFAIATRIPFGYSSSNAAEVSSNIIKYFFGIEDVDSGQATDINGERTLD